ncbi:MAG: hypothetical protein AB7I50_18895 [Vicinamibacterales bacterium]
MNRAICASLGVLAFTAPLFAQELPRRLGGPNGPPPAAVADRPVPKLADGTVDLSGVWTGGGNEPLERLLKPGELEGLMLPGARKLKASRKEGDDPYFLCLPGGPVRLTGGFAWRFVQHPTTNSTHIFQLQEANAHTYRQIFMNAKHPEDPSPTWYGHSIGRWEGDTLVIDTIGLNDRFWLDSAGAPHTEQLHLIERWTRTDYNTLRRDVTIDDPGAYTKPFTVTYTAKLSEPGSEILEYICIENNQYGLSGGNAPATTPR